MPPTAPARKSPLVAFGEALHLVFGAIALAEKGLEKNPSPDDERALNQTLIDLELQRAEIQAKIDALIAQTRNLPGPTAKQVAEISRLTGEVEAVTNASLTASRAVALTSRTLALATEVATG
jgi:serine protease inhibitor ecotin